MICYFHKTLGAINIHVSKTNFTIYSPPPWLLKTTNYFTEVNMLVIK